MASWFDKHAKASAGAAQTSEGLSRRQLIRGGAVVAGAAWVAPSLLTATPAWAGASICDASNPNYAICQDGVTFKCCPTGQSCLLNKQGQNVCDIPVGGDCGNRGDGQCNAGFSRCNHLSGVSICGGPGAICAFSNNVTVCVPGSDCTGVGKTRCGGEGATCAGDSNCANGSTGSLPDLHCTAGVCA
jgi:hypothetical protein